MDLEYVDEYGFSKKLMTPGENIVWKGKPSSKHLITKQDLMGMPILLFATCAFVYNFIKQYKADGDWKTVLFFIFPVLILLYLMVGRFIHTAFVRKRTRYVITNRKIIRKRGKTVDMLDSHNMPPMRMTSFDDGSGTIVFGEPPRSNRRHGRTVVHIDTNQFTLEVVENVARIHQLISSMEES